MLITSDAWVELRFYLGCLLGSGAFSYRRAWLRQYHCDSAATVCNHKGKCTQIICIADQNANAIPS